VAYDAVIAFLQRYPSFHGLKLLIELRLAIAEENSNSSDLLLLQDLLQRLLKTQVPYRCQQCGFSSKALHWQCPSCKNWETMKYQKAS
jgi:lipopolysaccharide biosynthesis regulator YciM